MGGKRGSEQGEQCKRLAIHDPVPLWVSVPSDGLVVRALRGGFYQVFGDIHVPQHSSSSGRHFANGLDLLLEQPTGAGIAGEPHEIVETA